MEQARFKGLITEAITNLCKTGLSYKSEFCIEGLLGITLDNEGVFLINIKETISTNKLNGLCFTTTDQRDLCDLTNSTALSCGVGVGVNDCGVNYFAGTGAIGNPCDRQDKQDAFQLNALDLNIANGKLSDLEILFDLSTTPGRKKDILPMDMTTSFLGQEQEVEEAEDNLVQKAAESAKEENDEGMSDSPDLEVIKDIKEEQHHLMQQQQQQQQQNQQEQQQQQQEQQQQEQQQQIVEQNGQVQAGFTKQDLTPLIPFDTSMINSHSADAMFLNLKSDYQLPACAGWEGTDYLDAMPLNLSEPQNTIQPQDLSIHPPKQKIRHVCDLCNKKFRSESGLAKHKAKEHSDAEASEQPQRGTTERDQCSQPLDLTTGRGENEGDIDDMDHDFHLQNQEPFNCVCGKVIKDYESYVEHVTCCSKSKLTPCKSCEICGKYFFSNAGYVKHKRLHIGSYKFHCEICHKGFFDRTHMQAHMDSAQRKVRRYECNACQKRFFWKHHLKRHRASCDKAKEIAATTNSNAMQTDSVSTVFVDKLSSATAYPSGKVINDMNGQIDGENPKFVSTYPVVKADGMNFQLDGENAIKDNAML